MPDPVTTALGSLMPFLNHLRPTKSPFLLVSVVIAIMLVYGDALGLDEADAVLFYAPVFIVTAFVVALSFVYTPPEITRHDRLSEDERRDYEDELDQNLRFSRSICLVAGLLALYLFFQDVDEAPGERDGFVFNVVYLSVLAQIAIFGLYQFVRSFSEERVKNYSVFQLGFLTAVFIISAVMCFRNASPHDGSYVINEGLAIDWNFLSFAVLYAAWACYALFWLGRLPGQLRAGRARR